MPDAPSAAKVKSAKAPASGNVMTELKVSGHLMMLDTGLFCVVQTPARAANASTGLPGVRLSLPPGPAGRPEAISIATFRDDGWLGCMGDAALVRVTNGPAHLLVTIYQAPNAEGGAPNIQVMRLLDNAVAASTPPLAGPRQQAASPGRAPVSMEMVAHIQGRGDVGALFGERLGEAGSGCWIEGFGLAPLHDVAANEIEYQAVLGRGWLSPWVEGGQFCGSRAMALPILGLRVRLRGAAAAAFTVTYEASFVDGTSTGPVADGAPCDSEAMVAVDSFVVSVLPRRAATSSAPPATPAMAGKQARITGAKKAGKTASGKPPRATPAVSAPIVRKPAASKPAMRAPASKTAAPVAPATARPVTRPAAAPPAKGKKQKRGK